MSETLKEKIKNKEARVAIVGLGYVGLPTSVLFAKSGFQVVGADIDQVKVEILNSGGSPIPELEYEESLKEVVRDKKLLATTDVKEAVISADIVLIVVPTPVTPSKDPDLGAVISAVESVASGLSKDKLVVLESTVYPGTTEEVVLPILERGGLRAGTDFGLAYCPERYNPGDKEHAIERTARIVSGITPEWGEIAQALYQCITSGEVRVARNIKTAEAAKVIENIQRDLNIALVNELALIFELMDIDVMDVLDGASSKWNFVKFTPGPGVGGHCLPVDPYYLTKKAQELGYHSQVILAGRAINDSMPDHIFDLLNDALNDNEIPMKRAKITILGFSYKANVGDPRHTPVVRLIELLRKKKANLVIVDPFVKPEAMEQYGDVEEDLYNAIKGANAIVIMTDHQEFLGLDLNRTKQLLSTPIIIDGRRILDPAEVIGNGFVYKGIGAGGW